MQKFARCNAVDEREELIRQGKAQFIDWEAAKEQIKKAIS